MPKSEKEDAAVVEFPRWIYPPDGGPGKVIHKPEEWTEGWLDTPQPSAHGASGERIIGQPVLHVVPPTSEATHVASAVEEAPTKKSKK